MDKIPEPGSVIKSKQNENNVNKILKVPKEINNRSNSSSSLEKSILDEIKK